MVPTSGRWGVVVVFGLGLTCCGGDADPVLAAPETTSAPSAAPAPAAEETAEQQYAECRQRVEQPEAPAECASDLECVAAGCNKTVCTTAVVVADGFMTTCDVEPCMAILDACACRDHRCQWSLRTP